MPAGMLGRTHQQAVMPSQPCNSRTEVKALARRRSSTRKLIVCESSKEDKPDFIERAFGALFGSKALGASEPFGMKRMSDEAYNEQSIATTTDFADPVEGDTEEVALFRPLLAKTRLEKLNLR